MLFNSIDFAIFLPIVFIIYWSLRSYLRIQNLFLVLASYTFYGWWDWKFLGLIAFSSILDYFLGFAINSTENQNRRKVVLFISVFVNLGVLGFFKYCNFFIDNFNEAFSFFGHPIQLSSLNLILPVGISFYTFQTLSYTADIYKKKLEPSNDLVMFLAFVSFFPQLVAGPIERAKNLLPQFHKSRTFDYSKAVNGIRQILWGLFKKIVIADNCAYYVSNVFDNYSDYPGSTLLFGAFLFSCQIYCDFSGYSDIAIGTSRLFGFNLKKNFDFPYFSSNIAEFWRKWHISLSSWFKDYVYIPLGGSVGSIGKKVRNTFSIFILSGFWHGANWTFIVWGAVNAIWFLPLLLTNNNRNSFKPELADSFLNKAKYVASILGTFLLTTVTWVFFRADSLLTATEYIFGIFSNSIIKAPYLIESGTGVSIFPTKLLLIITFFFCVEWHGKDSEFGIEKLTNNMSFISRYLFYWVLLALIIWYGGKEAEFIYFQF